MLKRAEVHPMKQVFKKHGVKVADVAESIGRSYALTQGVLTGRLKAGPETEKKIRDLAAAVEREAGQRGGNA